MAKISLKGIRAAVKNAPKEKVLLGCLLMLSLVFILYQSLIIIQIKRLKAVDLYFLSQKKLLDFYDRIMENADALKEELAEAQNSFGIKKEKFIDAEDLPNYFTHFRELVKSHGLKISALDFKPQEAITDSEGRELTYYQKLHFNASLEGDYFAALRLIYELEYLSPKIFDIQTLRIKQTNPQSREVTTDLEVTVYIFTGENSNDEI
jgi:hypothetical protein